MGDGEKASLRLQFNPKVRLAFHGATITTDAGLLAFREFDDALGLTEIAEDYLQESRTGRNILHHLVPLLRQSIYSRLAGYDDTNDAVRLSQDPAMRVIVGWQGSERKGASTSEMGRFETEFLTQEDNRQALARMNTRWVERAMAHTLHQRVILDMDSSELMSMVNISVDKRSNFRTRKGGKNEGPLAIRTPITSHRAHVPIVVVEWPHDHEIVPE